MKSTLGPWFKNVENIVLTISLLLLPKTAYNHSEIVCLLYSHLLPTLQPKIWVSIYFMAIKLVKFLRTGSEMFDGGVVNIN